MKMKMRMQSVDVVSTHNAQAHRSYSTSHLFQNINISKFLNLKNSSQQMIYQHIISTADPSRQSQQLNRES